MIQSFMVHRSPLASILGYGAIANCADVSGVGYLGITETSALSGGLGREAGGGTGCGQYHYGTYCLVS